MHKNPSLLRLVSNSPPRASATLDGNALVIRIEQAPAVLAPDDLVAFPFGVESAAATRLVQRGTLVAVKIGRRLYAKRSSVLALVDKLAATSKPAATGDAEADYAALLGSK